MARSAGGHCFAEHAPRVRPGQAMTRPDLEQRVTRAEVVLAERRFVSAIDVLVGLNWLVPSQLDIWRQGRVPAPEQLMQVNPAKVAAATAALRSWAQNRGLHPSETDYTARIRDRRDLRFNVTADAALERRAVAASVGPGFAGSPRQRLPEASDTTARSGCDCIATGCQFGCAMQCPDPSLVNDP